MVKRLKARAGNKGSVNKAQLIRDALKKLGKKATAKDVQAEVGNASPGTTVAPAQISNIRTKHFKRSQGSRAGHETAARTCGTPAATAEELVAARSVAIKKLGGVKRAYELLQILHQVGT